MAIVYKRSNIALRADSTFLMRSRRACEKIVLLALCEARLLRLAEFRTILQGRTNFLFRRLATGVESYWRNPSMRISSLITLCMAGALSLTAAAKAGQSAASVVPTKNVQAKNDAAQAAPAQSALAQNTAAQNVPAQAAPKKDAPAQSAPGGQNVPAEATPMERALRQLQFDKGIYLGRLQAGTDAVTGNTSCLAIQSYNFSQAAPGKMPKLESVTTCTSVAQPLMRQVRKPDAQNQQGQKNPK